MTNEELEKELISARVPGISRNRLSARTVSK